MKNLHWRVMPAIGAALLLVQGSMQACPTPHPADTAAVAVFSPKEIYSKDCSGCHGARAQGDAGPNLTDKYWLHGGTNTQIFSTIRTGYVAKGMIPWSAVFTDQEIHKMVDYLLLLQETNPPKAKKAEGELYEQPRAPEKKQPL